MGSLSEANTTEREDGLIVGQSDMISDVPSELVRVMTANSEALQQLLGQLPGQRLVKVPSNEG